MADAAESPLRLFDKYARRAFGFGERAGDSRVGLQRFGREGRARLCRFARDMRFALQPSVSGESVFRLQPVG